MVEVEKSTVPEIFRTTVNKYGTQTAMRQKKYGVWESYTWKDYRETALTISSALLELECKQDNKIAIIGENCREWLCIDMGAQYIGCVTAGIYSTNSPEQCSYIINHSDSFLLFAENEEQLDKWLDFRSKTPNLKKIIVWDQKGLRDFEDPDYMTFEDFLDLGKDKIGENRDKIEALADKVLPEDPAILVYTSGTTGEPKGAILEHGSLTWMGSTISGMDPELNIGAHDEVMSFLPLCHIFERLFSFYIHICTGYKVNFVESLETVPENMREISPTIGYGVPRIWEKFHSSIVIKMLDATWFKRLTYKLAFLIGKRAASVRFDRKAPPFWLKVLEQFAEWTVLYKLRQRMGMERMRVAYSGAAPISPRILHFFHSIGVPLLEGNGQTEGCGVSTFVTRDTFKPGTVGLQLPGTEIKLGEQNEILLKSPALFHGYYKNRKATDRVLRNGWLHSGDIGEMDEEGYLKIVDRKKDLIITAGGKNIAPQYIENKLKFSPYINDAVVIGDRRKYLSALIVLDEDNIIKFAQDHKIHFSTYTDLTQNKQVEKLIDREVQEVNEQLARVENIRKFTILPKKLYREDGEVTPTMKVKRRIIHETFREEIEGMY